MNDATRTTAGALVVLGCRVPPERGAASALERRARAAAAAYARTAFELVIASGGRRWDGLAEADALAERLEALGVPRDRIARDLCSLSTLENAAYSARILRGRGFSRAAVVTCDFHMRRAARCFAWMNVEATPVPAISPARSRRRRAFLVVLERARSGVDRLRRREWT